MKKILLLLIVVSSIVHASATKTPATSPAAARRQHNPNAFATFSITKDADGSTTQTLIIPHAKEELEFRAIYNSKEGNTLNCFRGKINIGLTHEKLITAFFNAQDMIAPKIAGKTEANRTFRIYLNKRIEEQQPSVNSKK